MTRTITFNSAAPFQQMQRQLGVADLTDIDGGVLRDAALSSFQLNEKDLTPDTLYFKPPMTRGLSLYVDNEKSLIVTSSLERQQMTLQKQDDGSVVTAVSPLLDDMRKQILYLQLGSDFAKARTVYGEDAGYDIKKSDISIDNKFTRLNQISTRPLFKDLHAKP
jgi:hypothetical protein